MLVWHHSLPAPEGGRVDPTESEIGLCRQNPLTIVLNFISLATAGPQTIADNPMSSIEQASPLASVVVVGYNQERFIAQAIESVLAQREPRIECIFVNDGSTDRSFEIVRNMANTNPRLRVYSINNQGPSNARNYGYSHISELSQYVCFLDGDDLLRPDFIGSCINYLERNQDVGVVLPGFDRVDTAGNLIPTPSRIRWAPGPLWLPRLLPDSQPETPFVTFYCGSGVTPFWLARRSVFDKTDGWDVATLAI